VSPFAAVSYSNRHEWVYAMGVVHTIRETGETGENGGREKAKVIVTHYHRWRIRRCMHAPALHLSAHYQPACVAADETHGFIADVDRTSINGRYK